MRRKVLAVVALFGFAIPTSIAVVAMAPAAQAASSVTCKKVTGTISGNITIKTCSVAKADKKTYKSLTGSAVQLATGGTLTWSSSGASITISAPTLSTPPPGTCKPKDTAETATGTVTAGDGVVAQTGDTFSATVCYTSSGKLSLAKGTVVGL